MVLRMARPKWRGGVAQIDFEVPADLVPYAGKQRWRETLRTRDPAEAKERFAARYAELMAKWRLQAAGAVSLSDARVQHLAGGCYRLLVERTASDAAQTATWRAPTSTQGHLRVWKPSMAERRICSAKSQVLSPTPIAACAC